MTKGPVLFELDETDPVATPSSAPPVPDLDLPQPTGRAMQNLAVMASRKGSRLVRFFWTSLLALLGFLASMAAWNFVTDLLVRNPVLGGVAVVLIGLFVLALLLIAGREWLALGRIKRIDGVRMEAEAALSNHDLRAAKMVSRKLLALYGTRAELSAGHAQVRDRLEEVFDADTALGLVENNILSTLDEAAQAQVEAAARQVATVTAIVPLALADLAAALTANLRMIRQIAEIYGGRSGTVGSWRLTRAVMTHLVATGAVAIGDDLISSVAGGGVMSKLSRRFGEGVINGALTARVGVAAIELCRPLPFIARQKPSVTSVVKRALTGLFSRD